MSLTIFLRPTTFNIQVNFHLHMFLKSNNTSAFCIPIYHSLTPTILTRFKTNHKPNTKNLPTALAVILFGGPAKMQHKLEMDGNPNIQAACCCSLLVSGSLK